MTITARLRSATTDWNGEPCPDESAPIYAIKCGELRAAADEIERLRTVILKLADPAGGATRRERDAWIRATALGALEDAT